MLNNYNDEYDHCYSMLHIRNFCKSNQSAQAVNPAGYCDYCNRIKADSNESKSKSLLHLNECRSSFYNHELDKVKANNIPNRLKMFIYDNHRNHYQCTLCKEKIDHSYTIKFSFMLYTHSRN